MLQKKICILGSFAAGKTSLVSRLVHNRFSDKYLTTIGVRIDKKSVTLGEQEVNLIVWDLYGEDEFLKIRTSYLRGASGYLLVVDSTRRSTLDTAVRLQRTAEETVGTVPFVLALNKCDLREEWSLTEDVLAALTDKRWQVIRTSAKTGEGVEEAFLALAERIVEG